jgi:hypothetical protein
MDFSKIGVIWRTRSFQGKKLRERRSSTFLHVAVHMVKTYSPNELRLVKATPYTSVG